jgi:predicted MFS family arabinose efflux permease
VHLEKANGRMWSVEGIANTFVGPPLGSLLLLVAFSIPFFIDATTFFAAAALVLLIPGTFRAERAAHAEPTTFRQELSEGVRWLMAHPLLSPMAIILGLMNMASMVSGATFVLFCQEVVGVGPLMFTVIGFGGAFGGIVGGQYASKVSERLGSGTALALTLGLSVVTATVIGMFAYWPVTLAMFAVMTFWGLVWNVITVSLRQTIIPPVLLGRVNSVYRFFAWGMMPIGAALGGVLVYVVDQFASRDLALRWTWFANAIVHVGLFVVGRAKLTTDKIEAARAAALAQ